MGTYRGLSAARAVRASCVIVSAWVLLSSCEAPAAAGAPCERASECSVGLVCITGRCRQECEASRDCPPGARCLASESGLGRCSLPGENACGSGAACASGLECAGGECRTRCSATVACASDQHCEPVPGETFGTCAEGGGADAAVADAAMRDASAPDDGGVDANDDAGCPRSPCSALPTQCGCAPGYACHEYTETLSECLPAGPGVDDEPCTSPRDCAAGYECVATFGAPQCQRLCSVDADCRAGTTCSAHSCYGSPCDLVTDTGCPAGLHCMGIIAPGRIDSVCLEEGTADVLEPCERASDCRARLGCDLRCTPWCNGDADCSAGPCLAAPTSAGVAPPPGVCTDDCDPLDPIADCGAGAYCTVLTRELLDGSSRVVQMCSPIGAGAAGAACVNSLGDCGVGLLCIAGRCDPFCDLDAPSCPTGTCRDFGMAPVRGHRIGGCG